MKIKGILPETFQDYKKAAMLIEMPKCSFKCLMEKGLPKEICQNNDLFSENDINVDNKYLIDYYLSNNIISAVIFGGLEPLDSFEEVMSFIDEFRNNTDDDIIIYTGYNREEVEDKVTRLANYKNIIVKFGRFIPNELPHFDSVLGVNLISDNQYAEKIS